MEHQEQDDPVWELIKNAKKTEPSPFFSRNVVREIRGLKQEQEGFFEKFSSLFRAPALVCGGAFAALALAFVLFQDRSGDVPGGSAAPIVAEVPTNTFDEESAAAFDPAAEIETIEYLGQLMVVADPGQLSDDALADLFF